MIKTRLKVFVQTMSLYMFNRNKLPDRSFRFVRNIECYEFVDIFNNCQFNKIQS